MTEIQQFLCIFSQNVSKSSDILSWAQVLVTIQVSTAVSAMGALILTPSTLMETTSTPVSFGKFHTFGNY